MPTRQQQLTELPACHLPLHGCMKLALVLFRGGDINIFIANMDDLVAYGHEWCPSKLLQYCEITNIFRTLFAKPQSVASAFYPSTDYKISYHGNVSA